MKEWKKTAGILLAISGVGGIGALTCFTIGKESVSRVVAEAFLYAAIGAGLAAVILAALNGGGKKHERESSPNSELVFSEPNHTQPVGADPIFLIQKRLYLSCRGGYLNGKKIPVQGTVRIGRAPDNDVRYPENTAGISRRHATVMLRDGRIFFTDSSSTESYLKKSSIGDNTAELVPKEMPIELRPGDVFYLGSKENRFELVEE